jgi:hypothetical protein
MGFRVASRFLKLYFRIYSLYELIMLYLSIVAGLMGSVYRVIVLLFGLLIGLMRVDQSIYPDWMNEKEYKDETNTIYLSMIAMTHAHNHPVVITFNNYACMRFH